MSGERTLSAPHCIVRAAAGTGKTWLLTSRIVRLLYEGVHPGAILAITFTQKAAKEIQSRLLERLRSLAFADDATLTQLLKELAIDVGGKARARRLYEEYLSAEQSLRASTFHAFCQDLLRRFPIEAGIIPGFELIEDTTELEKQAWVALARDAKSTPALAESLEILLEAAGGLANTRQALQEFLAHRSDWWAYTELAEDPVSHATEQLRAALKVAPQEPLEHPDVVDWLRQLCLLLERHPIQTHLDYIERLARAAMAATADERRGLMIPVLLKNDGEPRQPSSKLLNLLDQQQAFAFNRARSQLLTALKDSLDRKRKLTIQLTSDAWYSCGQQLLRHYQQLKQDGNLLDFTDLEWKAYELLNRSQHAEWVQFKLDQRIDHVLVDEFQDTNPTQWRLLLPLLHEMAAGNEDRARSVFLVGDEKQSIYRFRRAQPALFNAAGTWLSDRLGAETTTQARSYRSSPAIMSFVNLVFDGADAVALPDFQAHDTHRGELWGRAELLRLIPDEKAAKSVSSGLRDPLREPRELVLDSRYRREGERLARMITEQVGRLPVAAGNGQIRTCRYSDILILLRDRTQASYFEQALRHAHIPHTRVARARLADCLEVRDLLHLIQLFLDPEDDLALASVLKSPIFSSSDQDLIVLAQSAATQRVRWWACLRRMEDLPQSPSLSRAHRLLDQWSARADRIPAHDMLDAIYNEGNIIERYEAAAPPHLRNRVRANLTKVLELALETDSGRFPSLARFLAQVRNGNHEAEAAGGGQDERVRLMTIHSAKGLEAPVVFLVDAARPPRQDQGVRALIEWPPEAARPSHFCLIGKKDSLDRVTQAVVLREQAAAQQEENNLLYVALTRAKQYLFISACTPRKDRDRFWYGRIEARLRTTAPLQGLEAHTDADADGEPWNTYGSISYGSVPEQQAASPETPPNRIEVDAALTRPLPRTSDRATIRPSEAEPLERATDPGHLVRARGIAIHRALQLITSSPDRSRARRQFDAQFHATLGRTSIDACWNEACRVVDAPALRALFDPHSYLRAENELPLLYQDGERQVFGIIDRLVFTREELVLIDYKTHEAVKSEDLATSAEAHAPQMRLYARGLERLWPNKRVRAVLLFTAVPEIVDIRV